MKKIFGLLAMLLLSLGWISCSENDIKGLSGGHYFFSLAIDVVDANGESYIEKATFDKRFPNAKVIIRGEEYAIFNEIESEPIPTEKPKVGLWHRNILQGDNVVQKKCFIVGFLFSVGESSFTIDWGDGSKNVITYKGELAGTDDGVQIIENYFIDGVRIEEIDKVSRIGNFFLRIQR